MIESVLSLSLPLTFAHATSALAEGLKAIATGRQVIDLGKVAQVDSSAIAVLLAWQRAALAAPAPASLTFVNASASLVSLATLYGVADLLGFDAAGSGRTDLPHH
ncbi:STAS domain-containing protein [Actimicrobium antarcticum]|uniref:STAS domain-containing protein n=1 Tax=Actimicrobium antarcticum TaxID=1051899 RepID=A0ABP7TWQ5_9BURK